jgi:hypothetical protein
MNKQLVQLLKDSNFAVSSIKEFRQRAILQIKDGRIQEEITDVDQLHPAKYECKGTVQGKELSESVDTIDEVVELLIKWRQLNKA